MKALITQREATSQYGEPIDVLEAAYVSYFSSLGISLQPVSNFFPDKGISLLEDKAVNALILTGGGSLPPQFYRELRGPGEQLHRDETEQVLIKQFRELRKPILAICRGMQYINGLMGGKVSRLNSLRLPRPIKVDHPVELLGEQWLVNQYHNDGIFLADLAPDLEVLAVDRDNGVVEAFTVSGERILALQWHPERPFSDQGTREKTSKLIREFLKWECG